MLFPLLIVVFLAAQSLKADRNIKIEAQTVEGPLLIQDGDVSPTGPGQFFGIVDGNTTEVITYTITNTGGETLIISKGELGPSSSNTDFQLTGLPTKSGQINVIAGESRNFTIGFTPTSQVPSSTITIESNATDPEDRVFTFAVAGRGNLGNATAFYRPPNGVERMIPNNDETPSFAEGTNFGEVLISSPPNTQPVNEFFFRSGPTGAGDTLKLTNAEIVGPDAGDFQLSGLGGSYSEGEEDGFSIKFNPTTVGEKTATLIVNTNDPGDSPYRFLLRGEGVTAPQILVEGRRPDGSFGVITDGDTTVSFNNGTNFSEVAIRTTQTHFFRITNNGDGDLELGSEAGSSGNFVIEGFPASPIGPGENETFTISFSPDSPGVETGSFAMTTNIPAFAFFDFALLATGTGPGLLLEQQNQSGDWREKQDGLTNIRLRGADSQNIAIEGEPTQTGNFRVSNTGNRELVISGRDVVGEGAGQFSLANFPTPLRLDPGEVHEFNILLDATAPGAIRPDFNMINNTLDGFHSVSFLVNILEGSEILVQGRPAGGSFAAIASGGAASFANGTAFPAPAGGGASVTSTFRFTNTGPNDLIYSPEGILGVHEDEFALTGLEGGALTPGENTEFTITFTPAGAGLRTAVFSMFTNDPLRTNFTFSLAGNAGETGSSVLEASFTITGNDGEVTFTGQPGRIYRLRFSDTLEEDSWMNVPGIAEINGIGSPVTFQVENLIVDGVNQRFYRIEDVTTP